MAAVWYRLRIAIRQRFVALSITAIAVGFVVGIVLTIASGAHRTATAPDRYVAEVSNGLDAMITQHNAGRPRTDEIDVLPGVTDASSFTFVFGGLADHATGQSIDAIVFSGTTRGLSTRLVEGRDADPANRAEFVASRTFVDATGARIGDEFDLATLTPQQAADSGFSENDPQGPGFPVTLVGVFDSPQRLDDPTPTVVVSPALLDDPNVGIAITMIAVDLEPGTDTAALRQELDHIAGGESLSIEEGNSVVSDTVRRAVATQARGLWVLAITTAFAGVVAIGVIVTRQVRPSRFERQGLAAIGFTSAMTTTEAFATALVPIVSGSALGAVVALTTSRVFPSGFARVVEPDPGTMPDWTVVAAGATLLVLGCAAWVLVSLAVTRTSASVAASPVIESIATHTSATTATGMRLAFVRSSNTAASGRGALIGITIIVVGVAASITFGVSLDRLVDQPFRYGANFDGFVGDNGADTLDAGLRDTLVGNPDVTSLVIYAGTTARAADTTTPVIGFDSIRGGATPYLSRGRLPAAEDEIAFGRVTAADLGVGVNDAITLTGPTGAADFTVTGIVVMPSLGSTDGMGSGGLVTMGGLGRVDAQAPPTGAAIKVRDDPEAFVKSTFPELAAQGIFEPLAPSAIRNLQRVAAIPFVLAGLYGLLALLSVGQAVAASTRHAQRDLAVLRALGASGGWVGRAVHWQATLFTLSAMVIGIPIGVVVGRQIFRLFADNMGVVDAPALPIMALAAGAAVIVGAANVAAAFPARSARHRRTAALLSPE